MVKVGREKTSLISKIITSACILFALVMITVPSVAWAQEQKPAGEEGVEYAKDSSTEINVKNADIAAVVRIFSKKTKRNYILDETVKGKVTIYLPGKVSADEAIRILDSVLALKGFTSVPIGENLWKIVPIKDAKTSTIPTRIDGSVASPSSAVATRLINLKYVSAEDMQQLVTPLIAPEGLVNAYTGTNSLMIIDSEDNIERIVDIVTSLDVPSSDRDMTIVPVQHADAVDIAEKLNQILGISSESSRSGAAGAAGLDPVRAAEAARASAARANAAIPPGSPAAAPVLTSASGKTISARAREPKIIPDERTNSIIIVADEDTTVRMKALIFQLDSEVDLSGYRFYVYRCQHANAEELAEILSGLGGEGGSTGTSGRDRVNATSSFGRNQREDDGTGPFGQGGGSSVGRNRSSRMGTTPERLEGQRRSPGQSSEGSSGSSGASSFKLGEDLSISADPATNSLIIWAGKADYEKIVQLLRQLDIKRRQVLVEAILLEVGVDESQALSTEFLASGGGSDGGVAVKSDFGNLTNLFSNPSALSNFSVAAASAGTLTLPGGTKLPTQSVLVRAAKENANANVLSSPNILATDNEPAYIIVGQNVPFLASQATSDVNLNNTFNQIDRQDVGITLRLTPQISSEDYVTLYLFTEVSNLLERTLGSPLGPTTTVRTSETTVIAKDGQMIVIGGLMSDDNTDAESGVPFLADVPVLGHMFRSSSQRSRRTNLLIFITPSIVKDQHDARDATIVNREKMEDVIAREETYPDRNEVLHNRAIDDVTESKVTTEGKPGTIIPPARPKKEVAEVEKSNSLQADTEGAIELKVAPELPKGPSASEQISLRKEPAKETRASLKASTLSKATEGSESKIYIMSIDESSAIPDAVPFGVNRADRQFALLIPAESNAYSRGFFQIGEQYRYSVDGQMLAFRPVAAVKSPSELKSYYPALNEKLYTLSPYEIMNIGISPWVRAP